MAAATHAKQQIGEFLRFFDVKRDLYVAEVEHVIKDVKEARLFDDMYSKDDLEDIFSDLMGAVKERVKRDLETNVNMAALVLEHLFVVAAEGGVTLTVDMAATEDEVALARIKELNVGATFAEVDLKKRNVVKLESLRDEHQRLVMDTMRLTEECNALRERNAAVQAQAVTLAREKAEVQARMESLAAELAALKMGATTTAATTAAHDAELAKLRSTVAELHAQVEAGKTSLLAAEKEREATVNNSKQFIMMKQMLTKKNAQLAELRAALKKHEGEGMGGSGAGEDGVVEAGAGAGSR